uniref:Uncharacterized protein n=1 Tax=Micrurus carvalhoi TaxID=3147026 RepID=A0A2H6NI72_9SAUR
MLLTEGHTMTTEEPPEKQQRATTQHTTNPIEINPRSLPRGETVLRSSSEDSGSTVPDAPEVELQELPLAGTEAAADPSAWAAASGITEVRRSSHAHRSPAYLCDYVI